MDAASPGVRRSARSRSAAPGLSECVFGMSAEEYNLNMHYERVQSRKRTTREERERKARSEKSESEKRSEVKPGARRNKAAAEEMEADEKKKRKKKRKREKEKEKIRKSERTHTAKALEEAEARSWLQKGAHHELVTFLEGHGQTGDRVLSKDVLSKDITKTPAPAPSRTSDMNPDRYVSSSSSSVTTTTNSSSSSSSSNNNHSFLYALALTAAQLGDTYGESMLRLSASRPGAFRSPIPPKDQNLR